MDLKSTDVWYIFYLQLIKPCDREQNLIQSVDTGKFFFNADLRTFITTTNLDTYPPEHFQVHMCRILAVLGNYLNS